MQALFSAILLLFCRYFALTVRVINEQTQLTRFASQVSAADWVALDTEADSLHCYPEKLCLLQISVRGRDELVDPLADLDLAPLFTVLYAHALILHGADYDLRLLYRGHAFQPKAIFDTMLAARYLGQGEFGLTHLVFRHLGVRLEKGPQKANWAKRPLTERMVEYAHNDTRYLRPLAELLSEELRAKDRLAWHQEACHRLIAECAQPRPRDPDLMWRIKGSERLSRRSLSVLRELWHWREQEALRTKKPPYFIASHELLITVAEKAAEAKPDLIFPSHISARRKAGLSAAIQCGLAVPSGALPHLLRPHNRRYTDVEQRRFQHLRKRRDHWAEELQVDPTLIASRATLLLLAQDWEQNQSELLPWQRELLKP